MLHRRATGRENAGILSGFCLMRAVRWRTIAVASFLGGFVAVQGALVIGARAVGIPGLYLLPLGFSEPEVTSRPALDEGGETTVAKLPAPTALPVADEFFFHRSTPNPPRLAAESPKGQLDVGTLDPTALVAEQLKEKPVDTSKRTRGVPPPIGGSASPVTLPWDATEPIPYSRQASLDTVKPGVEPARIAPPDKAEDGPALSADEAQSWVRANKKTFKGANRARPMLHFELWLEPPAAMRDRILSVSYDVEAGAVQPRSQQSRERQTGFRVGFGGLGCADRIKLTLRLDDGRAQEVDLDGCNLPGKTG